MKKLWTKFKHWLIKKLGGYVNEPIRPTVYRYNECDVVTLTARIKVDWYEWLGPDSSTNRERAIERVKLAITSEIFNRADDLVKIDVDDTPKLDTDMVTVRATVKIVKTK